MTKNNKVKTKTPRDYRVFFTDERTDVGCGWRGIRLKKAGYKWAFLQDKATGKNFKMKLKMWNSLRPIDVDDWHLYGSKNV